MTRTPATTRPNTAPAYYLGRPASWWMTATTRQRAAPTPAAWTGYGPTGSGQVRTGSRLNSFLAHR